MGSCDDGAIKRSQSCRRNSSIRQSLRAAAIYNICWGAVVVLFPNLFFDLFALPHINYPFVMSGLGMCIGLYGYGYWAVANDPRRYPQIVLIGLLGKVLGPIGWFLGR